MASTSSIIHKPQNKSSAENTTSVDICLISYDNDKVCSQCGHDHSHKPIGGSAILGMISFLDRDRSKEI